MKKSLIALAIASAVSAPAFAATSNVDIYGVMHLGVNRIDFDSAADNSTSVTSNASRIGFKGTEDLGGGLAAIWQVETTINAEEGGAGSQRNTFVGLKGGFGTVLLGNHDTPMKMLARKIDNFGDTIADSRGLLGAGATDSKSMFDLRTKNTIAYVSPNFSGVTVAAAYVTDHQSGVGAAPTACDAGADCNVNDAYSLSADYTNGPLLLGAAYETHNISTGAATEADRSMWRLVAGYTFGNFKLGAQYENGSADTALAAADRSGWGVFANYAMGNVTLKANYLTVGDYEGVNDSGAKQFTVGADYALSKRTTAYALYSRITNDANGKFALGIGSGAPSDTTTSTADADPSVFGVGLKHVF